MIVDIAVVVGYLIVGCVVARARFKYDVRNDVGDMRYERALFTIPLWPILCPVQFMIWVVTREVKHKE